VKSGPKRNHCKWADFYFSNYAFQLPFLQLIVILVAIWSSKFPPNFEPFFSYWSFGYSGPISTQVGSWLIKVTVAQPSGEVPTSYTDTRWPWIARGSWFADQHLLEVVTIMLLNPTLYSSYCSLLQDGRWRYGCKNYMVIVIMLQLQSCDGIWRIWWLSGMLNILHIIPRGSWTEHLNETIHN
jgi:hypothetical protein